VYNNIIDGGDLRKKTPKVYRDKTFMRPTKTFTKIEFLLFIVVGKITIQAREHAKKCELFLIKLSIDIIAIL